MKLLSAFIGPDTQSECLRIPHVPRLVGAMAIVDQCLTRKARLAYTLGK
jgi:hypothetical protein